MAKREKLTKQDKYLQAFKGFFDRDMNGSVAGSSKPKENTRDNLDLVLSDTTVRAALKVKVNSLFKRGYTITDIPEGKEDQVEYLQTKGRLRKNLIDFAWQLEIHSAAFMEPVLGKGTNKVLDLPVLNTTEMELLQDDHGKINGYIQFLMANVTSSKRAEYIRQRNLDGFKNPAGVSSIDRNVSIATTTTGNLFQTKTVEYSLDEIFFVSTNNLTSNRWGLSEMLTLKKYVHLKQLIEKHLRWMFASNQFRVNIRLSKDDSPSDIAINKQLLVDSMNDPEKFLLTRGDGAKYEQLMKLEGLDQITLTLDYVIGQILALLQVTPIQVGNTGTSNRGSADTQYRYVNYDDIRARQIYLEDEITNNLFHKIGLEGAKFKFNVLDDKSEKDYIEMATSLINMGANPEKINKWLIKKGLDIPDDLIEEINEDPNEVDGVGEDTETGEVYSGKLNTNSSKVKLDKNSPMQPSRKPTQVNFEDLGQSLNG